MFAVVLPFPLLLASLIQYQLADLFLLSSLILQWLLHCPNNMLTLFSLSFATVSIADVVQTTLRACKSRHTDTQLHSSKVISLQRDQKSGSPPSYPCWQLGISVQELKKESGLKSKREENSSLLD